MLLKPARYANVTGNRDKEQGPRLVSKPPLKTSKSVRAPGLSRPVLSKYSLLRAKSEMARFRAVMVLAGRTGSN